MVIDRPVVAIFNGDPIIREALELLLQAAGYRIQVLPGPAENESDELLADCDLLLVAPELSASRRKRLLDMVSGSAARAKLPILELLPEGREHNVWGWRVLLWPCSIDQLSRAIDYVLPGEESD
jgi:hypothetical protein